MSNPYTQPPYSYGQQPQMPMPNQYGQGYYQQQPQGYYQPPPPQGYYQSSPPSQPQKPTQTKVDIPDTSKTTSNGEFKKSKIEFNDKPSHQDVWATFLYLATLAVTIAIAVISIPKFDINKLPSGNTTKKTNYNKYHSSSYNNYYYKRSEDDGLNNFETIILLCASFGSAAAFTLLYMILVQKFTGKMIKGTFFISIGLNFLSALITFFASPIMGLILIIFAGLYLLCYFFWRSRIPFAKVVLKTVTAVTRKYPATIFIGFIGCVVAIVWYGLIAVTIVAALSYWGYKNNSETSTNDNKAVIGYVVYVFLIFSFFFTSQVINNVVHVTISGVFATYYFRGVVEPGTNKIEVDVRNPTIKSFKRAMTTSFGSICFGSLLIALVSTLRVLASQAKHEAAEDENYLLCIIACCVECILSCIEDGIEYFNKYAFTEVAIYGKPYCQAAKDTWTLCKARGIEALINDNIIGNVLSIGAITVGCLAAAVVFALGFFFAGAINPSIIIFTIIAFLAGILIFSVVAQVIDSGVATTFVCLCEDPDALRQTKPELWEKVRDTYPSIVY